MEESKNTEIEKKEEEKAKPQKGKNRYLVNFLIKIALIVIAFLVVHAFLFEIEIYHGNDMYPAVKDGDLLLIYKLDKHIAGDVVLYENQFSGKRELSRIFTRDGVEIDITPEGEPTINGAIVTDSVFYKTDKLEGSTVEFPYKMKEGDIFLLDDYRTIGNDSRAFGSVRDDDIVGKVLYLFRKRGI